MNYAFSSPLKAVQGTAIKDLTDGRFHPPDKSGRSRSPCRCPTKSSSSASSSKPYGPKLSFVLIPNKPKYIPNQRPPPQVHSNLPEGAAELNERSRKVVISRFLLVDGNISFAVGTQIDGVITPDAEEVPVAQILHYVTPAELERFENQDFVDEDERERLRPPQKPRGRPRKGDRIVPSFNIAPIGEETLGELSLLPGGLTSTRKKAGRPRGSIRKNVGRITSTEPSIQQKGRPGRPIGSRNRGSYKKPQKLTSTKPSVVSKPSTSIKRARGRPRRQTNFSVVIPSFSGPQPRELESSPGAESESDEMLDNPKPQYSMVTASGLGLSDIEDVTSRDQSVELVPSLKKRSLATSNAFINLSSDDNDDERSPHPTKRAKTLSETSPDPIADDSTALLRQFQARVYGPDDSAKGRQSTTSPTLDDSAALLRQFHAHTRHSSLHSSSSDSLMGPTSRPHNPLPTQYISPKPLPGEASVPRSFPRDNLARIPEPYRNNSTTVSHFRRQPAKATPQKATSPSKSIQRKVSLTPHFPPSTSFSQKSMNGSAESRPQSSIKPTLSQPSNPTFTQSSRTMPSPPKKRKLSPEPRIGPTYSSQTSSTSKIGFAGLPRAKDITDYFAPKATAAKPALIKAPHSPTMQLLGPGESESEDQLARVSSSDSISSEVIVVRQNRVTPTGQANTAEARPEESEDGSSEDEREDSSEGEIRVSNTAASEVTASRKRAPSSAEALSKAFEIEDDDDEDSSSESDSESDSSEVMIVRRS